MTPELTAFLKAGFKPAETYLNQIAHDFDEVEDVRTKHNKINSVEFEVVYHYAIMRLCVESSDKAVKRIITIELTKDGVGNPIVDYVQKLIPDLKADVLSDVTKLTITNQVDMVESVWHQFVSFRFFAKDRRKNRNVLLMASARQSGDFSHLSNVSLSYVEKPKRKQ